MLVMFRRNFVLLGSVNGRWGNDDDGNLIYQDGFTSGRIWNGNKVFEMLQWFHNKLKAGKYVNASFFNSYHHKWRWWNWTT